MRTGGGDAGTGVPRLQRIFEAIAARRGPAFDPTDESLVGAENMMLARAIDQDLYGANERFANEMLPATSTALGLLPRWEKIFGVPPAPGDAEQVRQLRVANAAQRFLATNNLAGIDAVLSALMGPVYTGLVVPTPSEANIWWPGLVGSAAKITGVTGNLVTIAGLANVPTDAVGNHITVANAATAGNNGSLFQIATRVSASSVVFVNNGSPASPDYGAGGSSGSPTIQWALVNRATPWTSTLMRILVEVNPSAVPGYLNPDGTIAGAFFALVNKINPVLDWLTPADHVFDWFVESSHGAIGFWFDEPNFDVEAFDS